MGQQDPPRVRPTSARLVWFVLALAMAIATVLSGAVFAEDDEGPAARAAACEQFDVSGTWTTHQANGYDPTFSFSQSGTRLSGSASLPGDQAGRAGFGSNTGSVSGSMEGRNIDVTVTWTKSDGSSVSGRYTAKVSASSQEGRGTLNDGDAGGYAWTGSGPATCTQDDDPCAAGSNRFSARASQTCPALKVVAANVTDEVSVRSGNGEWRDLTNGTEFKEGDEIHTGAESSVLLKFSDGTTVQINELTQVKINTLLNRSDRVKMEMLLRIGDMKAKIKPQTAAITDFRARTEWASSGTRGTVFSVFHDAVANATIVSTNDGKVSVNPTAAGLPTTIVPAGKELEVTNKRISKLAPIGKAGARGGVNRKKARALVLDRLDRCNLTTPRKPSAVGVKPAPRGWLVTVTVRGEVKGTSKWRVRSGKARPKNRLARKIARGCG